MWTVIQCEGGWRLQCVHPSGYVITFGRPKRQKAMAQIMCDYLNRRGWSGI